MGINKVMLLGNLGKDPEVRYTPQQMAICQFSLATGERKKDTNGQVTLRKASPDAETCVVL